MTEEIKAEIHYQSLYRFAVSLSKHAADAEDLVHQTYLKWLKNRDTIKDTDRTESWLFTTLYREFLHGRKVGARQTPVDADQLDNMPQTCAPNPGDKLDAEYAMSLMKKVPEPYGAPLSLFYVKDFSYREIAEVLEIAPGTVMSRIFRGKQILKELMAAGNDESTTKQGQGAA